MNFLIFLNSFVIILGVAFEANALLRFGDDSFWPAQYEECGGQSQSPILISSKNATPLSMSPIEMVGYDDLLPAPITIGNNGHTIEVIPSKLSENEISSTTVMPYITGGRLPGEFELEGFHFHWGSKDDRGSEHLLDGVQYAMELHIVHRNKKYDTMDEALQHRDGAAVLGFVYEVTHTDGREIALIIDYLRELRNPNTAVEMDGSFSLADFIAGVDKSLFYTYEGSLTTPPCSEAVTWTGYPHPLNISHRQISLFRRLRASDHTRLVDNYRSPQPLNGRVVYVQSQTL